MANKKPKLSLDKTYGPSPAVEGRYGSSATFVKMYRAYQWTQGYDVKVAHDVPEAHTTLACATHPDCGFSISAIFHTFNDPDKDRAVLGLKGYRIATSLPGDYQSFVPSHSHVAPYLPMNVEQENLRRSVLRPGDPSLDNPPLVRVEKAKGFAEGTPPADFAVPGPSASTKRKRSSSVVSDVKREPNSSSSGPNAVAPPPSRMSTASSASHYTNHQPPPSYRASPVNHAAPIPSASSSTFPPGTPSHSATPAPPAPFSIEQQALASTPLGSFLVQISPSFLGVLARLDAAGIPLETTGRELVDLDSDETTIWDLFNETGFLSIAQVALATDGVRKARDRLLGTGTGTGHDDDHNYNNNAVRPPPDAPVNPKLVQGLQKAKTDRWVRRKIAEGQALLSSNA